MCIFGGFITLALSVTVGFELGGGVLRGPTNLKQLSAICLVWSMHTFSHVRGLPSPSLVMVHILVCNLVKASLFPVTVQEVAELERQLQSCEREKLMFRQQLTRKEAQQTRAEETITSKQQVRESYNNIHIVCMHPVYINYVGNDVVDESH